MKEYVTLNLDRYHEFLKFEEAIFGRKRVKFENHSVTLFDDDDFEKEIIRIDEELKKQIKVNEENISLKSRIEDLQGIIKKQRSTTKEGYAIFNKEADELKSKINKLPKWVKRIWKI